ncbi:mitochondrial large subunit ribosomal protein-domain-containing protein [Trametes meyenii]|nr:mitochondrial large subunit ribosomal protein-domain-containing protein [Trametes meyenii]
MLTSLAPRLRLSVRQARLYSSQLAPATAADPVPPPPAAQANLLYRVSRNSRGSIPVYTDIRNGGTRHLTLIRNVEGSVDALAQDLQRSLFPAESSEAQRMKVHTTHQRHVVLSGGRWKGEVVRWLARQGF